MSADLKYVEAVCLTVAKIFPGLSHTAFVQEVMSRITPRPDEYDVKGIVLRLVSRGQLNISEFWTVRLTV